MILEFSKFGYTEAREPFRGEPMPVVVKKDEISYDGVHYIPITEDEYEKYKYHPPGRNTKPALRID